MAGLSEDAGLLSAELVDAAAHEGMKRSRSPQEQLEHWARVGRLLSSGAAADRSRIDAALAGQLPLHAMTEHERAIVNAEISATIEANVAAADYSHGLKPAALETVALDEDGRLVRHHADLSQSFLDDA